MAEIKVNLVFSTDAMASVKLIVGIRWEWHHPKKIGKALMQNASDDIAGTKKKKTKKGTHVDVERVCDNNSEMG